jgi:hypothetical protein
MDTLPFPASGIREDLGAFDGEHLAADGTFQDDDLGVGLAWESCSCHGIETPV